jgi:hypothetical protein
LRKLEGQLKDNFPDDSLKKVQKLKPFRLNKKISKLRLTFFQLKM